MLVLDFLMLKQEVTNSLLMQKNARMDRGMEGARLFFSTHVTFSLECSVFRGHGGKHLKKPFKSPLLNTSTTRRSESSQQTPSLFNSVVFTPTKGPKAVASDTFSGSGSGFSSPMLTRGTPIRKVSVKKFVTPFKTGMRPGEPGHRQLKARNDAERASIVSGPSTGVASMSDGSRIPTRRRFFDLSMS
jgi:hypothetical protein